MVEPLKPRRRWLRRLSVVIVLLLIVAYFVPAIVARSGLVQSQVDSALAEFDGKAHVGSVSLGWFSPIALHDVTVKDAAGRTMIAAPKIVTSQSLLSLLGDTKNLGTITLEQPTLEIVCEHDTTNLEVSLKKMLAKPSDPNATMPTVAISLVNATISIADAGTGKTWKYANVAATAKLGETTSVTVMIPAPQRFECDVTLGRGMSLAFSAEEFPIDVVAPFLRRYEPGLALAGRISGKVETKTMPNDVLEILGAFKLRGVSLASPRLGPDALALETVEAPINLSVRGQAITVQSARMDCEIGTATLAGIFDLEQPTQTLLQQPGLTATLKIDLAQLARRVPKFLKLKPGTEISAGRIEAELKSQTAEKGTLWDGQCTVTALKGTRDGQPLAWDTPTALRFRGRLDDKLHPDFDSVAVTAEFARFEGRGRLEEFSGEGVVSLDKLAVQLAKFVDLAGTTLQGTATLQTAGRSTGPATDLRAVLKFDNFAAASRDWHIAARGSLDATARLDANPLTKCELKGDFTALRFKGFGVDVDEPTLTLLPTRIDYDRALSILSIPLVQLSSQTLTLAATEVSFAKGQFACKAATSVNLSRLQKALAMTDDSFGGVVRDGRLTITTENGRTRLQAELPVEAFRYGTAANPDWSEPKLTVKLIASYDPTADRVSFESVDVTRPDGTVLTAKGTITELSTKQVVDLNGSLKYDLASFEPQFKEYLGKSVRATGRDTRSFRVQGTVNDLTLLVADASLAWQTVSAYGFEAGKGQLETTLRDGNLKGNAVEATFAQTGKVKLQPTLRLLPKTYDLTFEQGRIIERATLTPAACAEALGFVLPAIAKSTQAEGTISFDLDEHRVLLTDVNRSTLKGRLILHDVKVVAGPVISQVAGLFSQSQPKLVLTREQTVSVRVENGRVYHENLGMQMGNVAVSTSGSVGFDGTLNLAVTVPVPDSAVAPAFRNLPAIRDAMAKKTFTITIGGTLTQPKLDAAAFNAALARFVQEVTRDAARSKLESFLNPKKP